MLSKCILCSTSFIFVHKGSVQCFSLQVVMSKYFLLNHEKNMAQIRAVVFEKNVKTAQLRRTPPPKK